MLEPTSLSQEHVLLCVDDDPEVLSSLKRLLRAEPYEVLTAQTPEQALEWISRRDVSLILTDQRMPGMCGTDLLEEVRHRSPGTLRVMLTGYPGSSAVSYSLADGVEWLISKPWNDEALKLTLRQLLHDRESRAPALRTPAPTSSAHARKPALPSAADLRSEIAVRFGSMPPFFGPALEMPEILENLWRQTVSAYLDNPLPPLFKEKLFAYLSRFCRVPYCIVRHGCALHPLGMKASEILALLEAAAPAVEVDVAGELALLEEAPLRAGSWPETGPGIEQAIFRCAVAFFLNGSGAQRCHAALRGVLGPALFTHLVAFLSYVRTCHAWVEAHPEITVEADARARETLEALSAVEPRLALFFKTHVERVQRERKKVEDKLVEVIQGLRKRETQLRKDQDALESRIQQRTAELSRVNEDLKKDITERKRAEEERDRLSAQLLQGQKLQAIGQLSAGIAHEINNPVGYILSNLTTMAEYCTDLTSLLQAVSALLERRAAGADAVAERAKMERLRREIDVEFIVKDFANAVKESKQGAERIRDIVRSLKEFSHVDEGALKTSDLNQCLEDTLRICWNEIKYKATVEKGYGSLPRIPCYPQRLGQVFMNLLVNAGQAIPERGRISISTRVEGPAAVIRIRDTGCGIPEENLKRLFEPFFTTKPLGKGTGLGLHVAYKIVKAHGGRIEVRSKVGEGAEFAVFLPLCGPQEGKAP